MSGDAEPNPGPVLGLKDLLDVLTELLQVSAKWYDFGLALKMNPGTLDAMKAGTYVDPRDCLREMLKEWLNTLNPTWEKLVAALRHQVVGKGTLASQLEAKYCTPGSQPPTAGAEPMEVQQQDSGTPNPKRPRVHQPSPPSGLESRDSRSLETTNPDTLELYATYLRETYDVQTPEFLIQWPPPPTTKVFNLAMVSKRTVERRPPNEELASLMLREGVSRVIKTERHTLVGFENLFTLDDRKRKVVLIEGAPGAGKSTLAWHICRTWKAQELFQEFKIVIYVQLRDPKVQSATSISDVLPSHPELKKEDVVSEIKHSLGKGILFVLDGWDEYRPGLQQGTLLHKLIRNPQELNLHYSTLLITSRPIASSALLFHTTSLVEIVGFLPREVHEYFKEAIQDPSTRDVLQAQLKECPVIEASCYLPLNAAIVAHVFMERKCTLPRTLHGVFSAMVCGCIRRYLHKQTERNEEIPSLENLPPTIEKEFESVCTLAYEGSRVNKVTFSIQDLSSQGLSADEGVLDLVQVVHSFANQKSKICYFPHLLVQELLAALHLSKKLESEQVQVFKKLFNKPRFAAVFRFYAAFTKLQAEGIRDIVARIAKSREKPPLLNLMHCLYEAQDVSLCHFVASELSGEMDLHGEILNPLDCLSVGYFLTCACTRQEFEADLRNSSVSVRFLARGLMLGPRDNVCERISLLLDRGNLHGEGARCLSEVIGHSSIISRLSLSWNQIQRGEDGLKHLLVALKTNTSIVYLHLGSIHHRAITEDNGPALVEMLTVNQTLQELDLSNNLINDRGLEILGEGLKTNRGIWSLNLDRLRQVSECGWKRFVLCLRENDRLTQLTLGYIQVLTMPPFDQLLSRRGFPERSNSSIVRQEESEVNRERQRKGLPRLVISPPTSQSASDLALELWQLQRPSTPRTTQN